MTDHATEPPPADPEPGRIQSIDALAAKVDHLAELVARVIPGSHAEAQQRTEDRLDRPSTVEEQVKAELERAKREEAEQKARDEEAARKKAEQESVAARLAALEEKPPAPPVRRSTKLLGWGPP